MNKILIYFYRVNYITLHVTRNIYFEEFPLPPHNTLSRTFGRFHYITLRTTIFLIRLVRTVDNRITLLRRLKTQTVILTFELWWITCCSKKWQKIFFSSLKHAQRKFQLPAIYTSNVLILQSFSSDWSVQSLILLHLWSARIHISELTHLKSGGLHAKAKFAKRKNRFQIKRILKLLISLKLKNHAKAN